ncbi:MAG TPA: MATE family efflux transporter [Candidatus Monoglobus merdigallinarum]|uniref:MATE family efflux transporter n=1 Tax=Candidatus Monoglobus merdigallinarum TaxID=2838698 RepID=A0A9D1PPN7_9FIRM|nr:MATE family efflux transporter [Candidatus Monoglobus merdigallinarum]
MESKKINKFEMDMCSGPILQKMLIYAVPLMFSGVLQLMFNAMDIVVVGKFSGDNSLAAVGSNSSIIGLLTNLFVGMSVAANVLVARFYGAKDRKALTRTVHTSMLMSLISGVIMTVIGIAGAEWVLRAMQTPDDVLPLGVLYLRIYFLGMPATMIYNFGSAILRGVGDTKRPLIYLTVAGVINVVLNLVFVIVFKLDVAGVAIATVISQCVSALMVVRCLMKERSGIRLKLSNLRIEKSKLLLLIRIGLPAGFQGMLFSLSNVVIQSSVNSFGPTVMAGNAAASNLESFVYMAMNAFHQATVTFTSQNYGALNYKRINKTLICGELCVTVVGIVFGNLLAGFGGTMLSIYTSSPEVIAAGMQRLNIISRTYALCGIMDVMVGSLRGIGYSVIPMIVSLIGVCVLRLVWIWSLFSIESLHVIETVYFSYPVSWLITFLTLLCCFLAVRRNLDRRIKTHGI